MRIHVIAATVLIAAGIPGVTTGAASAQPAREPRARRDGRLSLVVRAGARRGFLAQAEPGEGQSAQFGPLRLVEQLVAQIGGADRVGLVADEARAQVVVGGGHGEGEAEQQAEQREGGGDQIAHAGAFLGRLPPARQTASYEVGEFLDEHHGGGERQPDPQQGGGVQQGHGRGPRRGAATGRVNPRRAACAPAGPRRRTRHQGSGSRRSRVIGRYSGGAARGIFRRLVPGGRPP
jgi:hypothetical protein